MHAIWKLAENIEEHESQCFSSCVPSTPTHGESCSCRECTAVADLGGGTVNTYENPEEFTICKFKFLKT